METLEKLGQAMVQQANRGEKVAREAALSVFDFWAVARETGAKVESTDDLSSMWITVHTPAGTAKVFADEDVKTGSGIHLR